MKRFLLLALPLLAGCSSLSALSALTTAASTPPVQICDKTTLDEQSASAFELGYKVWRLAVESATDMKLVHGRKALYLSKMDNQLYALTLTEQAAYKTCNSVSFKDAIDQGKIVLRDAYAILGAQ